MTTPVPHDALLQHIIALGKTGSGKSSKLRVLVEEVLDLSLPVCIIDPKGDWWGLKSSADGKRAGYPIVIFGGEHADVPINEHSGAHVAELVATGNRSAIIDLGGWMIGPRTRFLIDLLSNYFRLARGRRYLVPDEVHNLAPQGRVLDPDAGKLLHWANRIASEGRGKGITLIAASQRPQKVHKDFLTSCETLIACKVIHKLDRDAIKDWIDGCADPQKGRDVLTQLASMPKPEAWVWSPEIDFGPKRVVFPLFRTYDSFKPQPDDAAPLKGWADVDLEEVKSKLAVVVQQAEANDPRRLKARIAELERQAKKQQPAAVQGISEAELNAAIATAERVGYDRAIAAHNAYVAKVERWLENFPRADEYVRLPDPPARTTVAVHAQRDATPATRRALTEVATAAVKHVRATTAATASTGGLSKAERLVLTVLAQYPQGRSRSQVAILTRYAQNGGGFNNALSSLRSKGCIVGSSDLLKITDAGEATIGPVPELPTGQELLEQWLGQLSKAEKSALAALAEAYPHALTKDELARRAGYEANGGGFNNALSRLRTLELITGRGEIRASEVFFP